MSKNLRELLGENIGGGIRCGDGRVKSLSGYVNRWYIMLERGESEDYIRNKFIKLVDKYRCVKEGDNLGSRLMEYFGIEGYKREGDIVNLSVSLKELGLICLCLESMCDGDNIGELWVGDREICEKLNERLCDILEGRDK